MSNLIEAPRPSPLSDQSLSVVEATAPVVAAHADEITAHFYPRMFAAHPELLRVFNQGHCRSCGSSGRRCLTVACRRPESATKSSDPTCGRPNCRPIRDPDAKLSMITHFTR